VTSDSDPRPRVGISSCLLGEKVRYNGADKRDAFLLDALGQHVEWVPVCPEVEVGMGTPREPVQLVRSGAGIRMIAVDSRTDYTEAMNAWAEARLEELQRLHLSGYVLKTNSPSCGKDHVKVFAGACEAKESAPGLFAQALLHRFPGMPIEEEDALRDVESVQEFLQRVRHYRPQFR
jgi:uncharacterized protein YbbK (DUF523 family)